MRVAPPPPPAPPLHRLWSVVACHTLHVHPCHPSMHESCCPSCSVSRRHGMEKPRPLRSPGVSRDDVLRDPVPLPAPPRPLPPFCFCVCVYVSLFLPVACASYPLSAPSRDPYPLRHQRYLSPLPCRPLRIRTLRTSPPPRAFSPQSAPPPAERHPVSNKALLSKSKSNRPKDNPSAAMDVVV